MTCGGVGRSGETWGSVSRSAGRGVSRSEENRTLSKSRFLGTLPTEAGSYALHLTEPGSYALHLLLMSYSIYFHTIVLMFAFVPTYVLETTTTFEQPYTP